MSQDPCAALAEERLNFAGTHPDARLAAIEAVVVGEACVDDLEGACQVLERYANCSNAGAIVHVVDFIGHGNTKGLLRLGTTHIDPGDLRLDKTFDRLAQVLRRLRPRALRLLGCNTADEKNRFARLQALKRRLGVEVCGTVARLYETNYDEHGLQRAYEGLVVDSSGHTIDDLFGGDPGLRHSNDEGKPSPWRFDARQLAGAGPDRPGIPAYPLRDLDALLALLDLDHPLAFPGLLAEPDCDLVISAGPWRAEVLLDAQLVRFTPDHDPQGVCFRVRDAQALRGLAGFTE